MAAEQKARVTYDNKMYDEAAPAFRRMYDVVDNAVARTEAANGYAESVLLRNNDDALMAMANDLDTLADVDAAMLRKVRFAKANLHASREEVAEARKIYEMLAADVSNVEGAESAYRIIRYHYDRGEYDKAENLVYELADSRTPHSYYLGRAFIVLGDIYASKNDTFQARATYQSIVDGYTPVDDGVVDEAKKRIEKLQ